VQVFIFTFQLLNLSLPVTQQLAVAFGGGVKLRLRLAAGLRQNVKGDQLAVFLAQLFALARNGGLLRIDPAVALLSR